jgi:hypothetical protein
MGMHAAAVNCTELFGHMKHVHLHVVHLHPGRLAVLVTAIWDMVTPHGDEAYRMQRC